MVDANRLTFRIKPMRNIHGIENHDAKGNVIPLCVLPDPDAPDVRECPHCVERWGDSIKKQVERMDWPDEIDC